MKRFRFKYMNNRLIFWFLVVSLVPLVIMTGLTYDQRIKSIRMEAADKLVSLATQKKIQISSWSQNITNDISFLAKSASRENFDRRGLASLAGLLDDFDESNPAVMGITLKDSNGGILLSTGSNVPDGDEKDAELFQNTIRERSLYISEPWKTEGGEIIQSFAVPVPAEGNDTSSEAKGVLSISVSLNRSIFNLLHNRTGLGNTGEALLVTAGGKNINSLLWEGHGALSRDLETVPVKKAIAGESGSTKTTDYRGEKVLAAFTGIPETGWGLVVKQDLIEVDTPVYSLLHIILIIFSFSVSGACALAILISRSISRPISEITEVAQKIDKGELNARNRVDRVDELGILARSINTMADSLLSLIHIQDGITGVVSTAVTHEGTRDFASALVKKLTEITESGMGIFYLVSEDGTRFNNIASTGVSRESDINDISVFVLENEFGRAFENRQVCFANKVNERSVFSFKTSSGRTPPSEIAFIPLIMERRVKAVIILASVWRYTEEQKNIVRLSANSMNASFSNIISNEKTNIIAAELAKKNEELEVQSDKLKKQSAELRKQSEKLLEQNIELEYQRKQVEEANRLKSEFLSNMSHELRTPLNSVLALSRVLKMQAIQKLSSEEAKYLEVIERNGKQLLALINDILDLSKIEAGRVVISPEIFSLKDKLAEISESIVPMIAGKDVDLKLNVPEDLPGIESDEEKIGKIITNLLSNAVKFTNKGTITLRASSDGAFSYIEVEDTGIGIPDDQLPYIFDEFRQVDGTSSRQYEGTGLGLAICKRTAELLGGQISVESSAGVGSKFTLELPVNWSGRDKVINRIKFSSLPKVDNPNKGKKIIVVDDDFRARTIITDHLTREGYEVFTADTGDKAIKMAYLYQPYAITLDLIMPDMDGWEVLQRLKDDSRTSSIPVIIVSVSEDKETGFALGAASFITKPIDEKTLLHEVRNAGCNHAGKVMIATENFSERIEMAESLQKQGYKVLQARNGKTCLDILQDQRPDILVLELAMSETDGFSVLEKIRRDQSTENMPVIAITGKDLDQSQRDWLSERAISVLSKSDRTPLDLAKEAGRLLEKCVDKKIEEPNGSGKRAYQEPKRILLVEDNEIASLQVKMILERHGYILDSVNCGKKALSYLEETIPDGIILDLMMPGMDGFEVLHKIRNTAETANVPILILTAKDLSREDFERLSKEGIQQLVQKGDIDREGLLQKARYVFGGGKDLPATLEAPERDGPDQVEKEDTESGRDAQLSMLPRVLIIEDNPDNLFTLKAIMGKSYLYLEAADGVKGLELATREIPDIILLDISIPRLDGYEVARSLKSNDRTRYIPVIAVTARAMKGEREKTLASGCDDYISKPVDAEILESKLDHWLNIQAN
jgi:CheY-like chemotaxis protein/signal transduction histidine kinase